MLLKYNQNKLMELQEFQYSTNHSSLDFLSQYQNAFVNYGTGRVVVSSGGGVGSI